MSTSPNLLYLPSHLVLYQRTLTRGTIALLTSVATVFPNTALVTATLALARALGSKGLQIYGCVMATALVLVWITVFGKMLLSLWRRQLLWPKELDKDG